MLLWWGLGPKRLRLPHCYPKSEAGSQGSKPGTWGIARQRLPQSITEEFGSKTLPCWGVLNLPNGIG